MVVLQHEHSLILKDLNPIYPHEEEVYDDEKDLIIKQSFQSPCNICCQKITFFHRYYYKCDQCNYLVHKLCGELPTKWKHASHSAHTLSLFLDNSQERCQICKRIPQYKQLCYHCSRCKFNICLDCGIGRAQYQIIYHPSHQHPLIPIHREKQISALCDACGQVQLGVFYHCATCFCSFIHNDCVFQLQRLLIQNGTSNLFFHSHPLILTYSFSKEDQEAKFCHSCRVCGNLFSHNENLWCYKCNECRYYVHLRCANLKRKPFDSENYEDHSKVFHLPLTDETYNIIKEFFLKENKETSITDHFSHKHPLILVKTRCNDNTMPITSSTITTTLSFPDLMNYIVEDLCYICQKPIVDTFPFYKCSYGCDFVLHEWCTRLPLKLNGCMRHKKHDVLLSEAYKKFGSSAFFDCHACSDYSTKTEISYNCVKCRHNFHVTCAFIPKKITHVSHPGHLLSQVHGRHQKDYCRMCLSRFTSEREISLSCKMCDFHLHHACALLFPEAIRHKYDEHPLALCHGPTENHMGDYLCEVCEEEINSNGSFYHCHECNHSLHLGCAPITPESKPNMYLFFRRMFMIMRR